MLLKISGYVKRFDQSKYMAFWLKWLFAKNIIKIEIKLAIALKKDSIGSKLAMKDSKN